MRSSKMSLNSNKMKIQFLIAIQSCICLIFRAIFWWKPYENWIIGSREICLIFRAIFWWKPLSKLDFRFQKYHHFGAAQNNQIQRKLTVIIYCILIKINISEFQLILLDLITNAFYQWITFSVDRGLYKIAFTCKHKSYINAACSTQRHMPIIQM